jgi:hypothetical protein
VRFLIVAGLERSPTYHSCRYPSSSLACAGETPRYNTPEPTRYRSELPLRGSTWPRRSTGRAEKNNRTSYKHQSAANVDLTICAPDTDLSDMLRRGRDDSSDDDHRSAREHPFPPSEAVRDDSSERGGDHGPSVCCHLSVTDFGSCDCKETLRSIYRGRKVKSIRKRRSVPRFQEPVTPDQHPQI